MVSEAGTAYIALEVVIAMACCLGNLLAIWALWAGRVLREPTFCFMVSLVVADFLVGALAIPMAILVDGRLRTSFHSCLIFSCMEILLIQASILMLLAIAVDRYLRVQIPLRYKRTVTQKSSWAAVGACWLLACLLGSMPMFGWHNRQTLSQLGNSTTIVCRFVAVIPMTYLVYFQFFGCTLLPLLTMSALYVHVFHSISRRLQRSQSPRAQSHAYYAKERKLAKTLVLVLVLFAVGWLPLCIMNCVTLFGGDVPVAAIYAGILLTHANSAVNPVVYTFKVPKMRQACLQAWRRFALCWRQGVPQATESKDNSSDFRSNKEVKATEASCDRSLHTTIF